MRTLFWGIIKPDGTLDKRASYSGAPTPNFTVTRDRDLQYKISLDEWFAHKPFITLTPLSPLGSPSDILGDIHFDELRHHYSVKVSTYVNNQPAPLGFSFACATGRTFQKISQGSGDIITFELTTLNFRGVSDSILVSTTDIPNEGQVRCDKGTVLEFVVDPNQANMFRVSTTPPPGLEGYTISAFTNGSGSAQPEPWIELETTTGFLQFTPPIITEEGAHLTLSSFTFVATKKGENPLTTDPIVRVTTVGS